MKFEFAKYATDVMRCVMGDLGGGCNRVYMFRSILYGKLRHLHVVGSGVERR